jgi:hypothetical protein
MHYVDCLLLAAAAANKHNAWLQQLLFIQLIFLMMCSKPARNM